MGIHTGNNNIKHDIVFFSFVRSGHHSPGPRVEHLHALSDEADHGPRSAATQFAFRFFSLFYYGHVVFIYVRALVIIIVIFIAIIIVAVKTKHYSGRFCRRAVHNDIILLYYVVRKCDFVGNVLRSLFLVAKHRLTTADNKIQMST